MENLYWWINDHVEVGTHDATGRMFDIKNALGYLPARPSPKANPMTERERASILLEAVWEAVTQLGVTDSTAEDILIPAILKTDSDPQYARNTIAEMRAAVSEVLRPETPITGEAQLRAVLRGKPHD